MGSMRQAKQDMMREEDGGGEELFWKPIEINSEIKTENYKYTTGNNIQYS